MAIAEILDEKTQRKESIVFYILLGFLSQLNYLRRGMKNCGVSYKPDRKHMLYFLFEV